MEEDEEWHRPHHRKRKQQHKEGINRYEFKNSTTFLVSNLPGYCNKGEVWREFQACGDLVDVFIPRKADRGGNRFAFIRYEKVRDVEKLLQVLNMVTLKGAKLSVIKARFRRDGKPFEEPVTVHQQTNTNTEVPTPKVNGVIPTSGNINTPFREALVGGAGTSMKTFDLGVKVFKSQEVLAKKSLLVETKDLNTLCNIKLVMKNVIHYLSSCTYVGGLKVLLTFYREAHCDAILEYYKSKPSAWFSSVERWDGQADNQDRVAWLKVDGVPPQVWDKEVFNTIGSSYGKMIYRSTAEWKDGNLSFECVGVLVSSSREISEEAKILWQGKEYRIWVSEVKKEWVPDFLIGSQKLPACYSSYHEEKIISADLLESRLEVGLADGEIEKSKNTEGGLEDFATNVRRSDLVSGYQALENDNVGTSRKKAGGEEMEIEVEEGEIVDGNDGRKIPECLPGKTMDDVGVTIKTYLYS